MAQVLGDQWPVGVCFFVGRGEDVKALAGQIDKDIRQVLKEEHAEVDMRLGKPIQQDIEALASTLATDQWPILQFVSHGTPEGDLDVDDAWGQLYVAKDRLSAIVRGHNVKLAIVLSCYGAEIARQLVDDGAVDVAIGMYIPMEFGVALAFSKGFHLSIARGYSIRRAFADGLARASLRASDYPEELHLFTAPGSGAADLQMCDPADFFLVGNPSDDDAIEQMIKALRPHTGFHVDYSLFDPEGPNYAGADMAKLMMSRFEAAKVVMLLFEGQRDEDATIAEVVARAVDKAAEGEVRMFPVYLKGTRPNRNLPFGMMRVVPAFLERFGSYEKLGKQLARLIP